MPRRTLLVLLVVFSLTGVFGHSLWGNDSREGSMIWDMWRHGQYVNPTFNGAPSWEKPPLMYWSGVFFVSLFGKATPGLLRLPSALAGLGTLLLVVWLARRRTAGENAPARPPAASDALAAWTPAFLCGTALLMLEYARNALTDATLTFCVTLGLALFWRGWTRAHGGFFARWSPFVLAAAGSFYAKGLIGPALLGCGAGAFLAWRRRFALLVALGAAGAVAFVLLVGPWAFALWKTWGADALRGVFIDNQLGRFFTFAARPDLPADPYFVHKEAWHFYLRTLPVSLLPWSPLVVLALVDWFRGGSPFRGEFDTFLRAVLLGMAAVLHASSAKVGVYALPAFPVLFLMTSAWLEERAAAPRVSWPVRLALGATFGLVVLLLVGPPVALVAGWFARPDLLRIPAAVPGTPWCAGLLAAGAILVLAVLVREASRPERRPVAWGLAPVVVAGLVIPAFALIEPLMDHDREVAPVVSVAQALASGGADVGLYSDEADDVGQFTFGLDSRLTLCATAHDAAQFLLGANRVLITRRAGAAAIHRASPGTTWAETVPDGAGRHASEFVVLSGLQLAKRH